MTVDTPAQLVAKSWGKRLRMRRIDLGKSQVALGRDVNMDQATISRYERGQATWTPDAMLAFSVALDMPLDRLFPWPLGIEGMEIMRREAIAKRSAA